mmetsp:Transcript_10311/g.23285  ORF Transcript_10311/g.23285 Transcript_10311/m.23285 type:complete len:237 (+) Transcript_10311:48-758(+)
MPPQSLRLAFFCWCGLCIWLLRISYSVRGDALAVVEELLQGPPVFHDVAGPAARDAGLRGVHPHCGVQSVQAIEVTIAWFLAAVEAGLVNYLPEQLVSQRMRLGVRKVAAATLPAGIVGETLGELAKLAQTLVGGDVPADLDEAFFCVVALGQVAVRARSGYVLFRVGPHELWSTRRAALSKARNAMATLRRGLATVLAGLEHDLQGLVVSEGEGDALRSRLPLVGLQALVGRRRA